MTEALRSNVKKMLEAGVPADKIKAYVQKYSAAQPQPTQPQAMPQPDLRQASLSIAGAPQPGQPLTGTVDPLAQWGELPGQIIPSAVGVVGETVEALRHPVETAKGIAGLVKGGIETLAAEPSDITTPEQQMFQSVVEGVKQKYGSMENLKKDVIKDPVGNLVNVASLFMVGGAGLKAAAKVGKLGKVAKAGDILLKTGAAMEPTTAIGAAVKLPLAKIADPFARKLYESAAKFSTTLSDADKAKLVQTGLEQGINVSKSGLGKLVEKRQVVESAIAKSIDEATAAGKTVSIIDLLKPISEVIDTAGRGASPVKGQAVAKNVRRELLKQWVVKEGKVRLTPDRVQQLKRAVYKELDPHYRNPKPNSPFVVQTKKAVARAAKESLEDLIPGIKQMNQKDAALIELNKHLEKAVSRIKNRDLMSLTTTIGGAGTIGAGAAGGAEAAIGAAMATLAISILKTPRVSSQIALIAHKLAKKGVKIDPKMAAVKLGVLNLKRPRYANGQKITLTKEDFERGVKND